MTKTEIDNFYNDGFGWICKHCERELKNAKDENRPRLLSEGESESKEPRFSNKALARWLDPAQTTLICPRCGTTEKAEKF